MTKAQSLLIITDKKNDNRWHSLPLETVLLVSNLVLAPWSRQTPHQEGVCAAGHGHRAAIVGHADGVHLGESA